MKSNHSHLLENQTISIADIRHFSSYSSKLCRTLDNISWDAVAQLADSLRNCWTHDKQVFICGNGGSAGNACHIANDLLFGIASEHNKGIRAHALSANPSILSCLANDLGYEQVFSQQLKTYACPGDLLLVLSGSGNSANIVSALNTAKEMGLTTHAMLGYNGGKCISLADSSIHFDVPDMQISEDLQMIVAHMITQTVKHNTKLQN